MNTQDKRNTDRRKARKFQRAAKHAGFWLDAPWIVRDRPAPRKVRA